MLFLSGIDIMKMSDRYAFDWLKLRIEQEGGESLIPSPEMAHSLGCHINTAQSILLRLRALEMIEIVGGSRRTGYIYRLKHND